MPSFSDFTFASSTGKNHIHARQCMPDGAPRAILQIAHGIAEYIDRYDDFAFFLAQNGILVVGNDHLATANPSPPPMIWAFLPRKTAGTMWCRTWTSSTT